MASSRVIVFISQNSLWQSHTQVRTNLQRAYRDHLGKNFDVVVKKVPVSGLEKSFWMRLVKKSFKSPDRLHLVCLDGGLPYQTITTWGQWMNPETTMFHVHVWSDVMFRQAEFIDALLHLEGFKGALHVCSRPMQRLLEVWLGGGCYHQHMIPLSTVHFEPLRQHGSSPKPKRISFVGRINVDKGVDSLLAWWRASPLKCELKLFGAPSYENELSWEPETFLDRQRELERSLSTSGISYRKLKSPRQVAAKLQASDVAITCSTFMYEEFGIAVAEAIAAGCPVVVSDWGGHRTFAKAPGVFTVRVQCAPWPSVNPRDLEKVMQRVFSMNETKLAAIRVANRKWARQNLSFVAVGKGLAKSLDNVDVFPRPSRGHFFSPRDVMTAFSEVRASVSTRV